MYRYNRNFMPAELVCFEQRCRARFPITEVIYNCPRCGGLLEANYPFDDIDPAALKKVWRERRMCNPPLDQSGVWRYREIIPVPGRLQLRGHPARRQHAAAPRPARRSLRRA